MPHTKLSNTIQLTSLEFSKRVSNYLHTKEWNYLDSKPCIIEEQDLQDLRIHSIRVIPV